MSILIKKSVADLFSDEAANELMLILEEIALEISKTSILLSNHARRKTIKSEDILLAYKNTIKRWLIQQFLILDQFSIEK